MTSCSSFPPIYVHLDPSLAAAGTLQSAGRAVALSLLNALSRTEGAAARVRSTRLREAQVDLRRRRVGPARRDDLAARIERDPLRPVDVRVAEERRLPPAERVVRDGHRDRNVDPDHA